MDIEQVLDRFAIGYTDERDIRKRLRLNTVWDYDGNVYPRDGYISKILGNFHLVSGPGFGSTTPITPHMINHIISIEYSNRAMRRINQPLYVRGGDAQ